MDTRLNRRAFAFSTALALASFQRLFSTATAQESGIYTFAVFGLDRDEGEGSQRSDVIMISRVNLNEPSVRTLSIPRDLYVEVPGYGYAKINHGFRHGLETDPEHKWQSGAESAVATITHNFGVQIDGVAVLEFPEMPQVIDAIGGVEVDNPYAVPSAEDKYPEGLITLNGDEATLFVRLRQEGDGGRVMRQQLVLAAMLEKLQQPEILPRIPELIEALSDFVHTDIDPQVQLQLIAAIPTLQQEDLVFTNIEEFLWSDYTPGGAWIYRGDWSTLPQYVNAWLAGEID
ncbi:MAG: LCP family protein [Thermomicrobiales bacterium]|nr:LCP family protein [Thermomicrobiales bacterium]